MTAVELRNVAKSYGRNHVLRDVNLAVEPGQFMVVFGLPISGKSVLVRLLTGLEAPDAGQIMLRGVDVTRVAPGARNIGYVPQSFALYPHFTVRDNIAYPLNLANVPKAEIEPEVQRVVGLLGIGDLLDRKPDQLSGGQKQRVAIARGLIKRSDIYILDDPLVGLDFKLRERLIDDLKQTQALLNVTFVYTTSDAVEAMMLGTEIGVLADGVIVETGPPEQLYVRPTRAETMRYVTFPQANIFDGTLTHEAAGPVVRTRLFTVPVELDASDSVAEQCCDPGGTASRARAYRGGRTRFRDHAERNGVVERGSWGRRDRLSGCRWRRYHDGVAQLRCYSASCGD